MRGVSARTTRRLSPRAANALALGAGSAAVLLAMSIAVAGPVVAFALLLVAVAGVAVASFAVLALAVPILATPIGLVEVPGLGGIQVIHIATMAAVAGVAVAVITGRVQFRPPVAMAWGALFVGAMLIATVTSADTLGSLRVSFNHVLSLGLAVSAAVVVRSSSSGLTWLLRGWTAAAVVVILPALPSALAAGQRFGGTLVEGRVQGVFAQPNDFGEFALLGLVVAVALLFGPATLLDRWLGSLGMVIGLAGVAVSFSRGTWMGLAAGVLVICVLSAKLRLPVIGAGAAAAIVVAVGSAAGAPPFPTLAQRLLGLLGGGVNPEDDRPVIYRQAVEVFIDHPVAGLGPGTFLLSNYFAGSDLIVRNYIHGHSILLTTAAEMGLIGVVALLMLTGSLAIGALQARRLLLAEGNAAENARLAVLCGGLVAIAVHGLTDVVYTNPLLIPLAWFLAGAVAGECAAVVDQAQLPSGEPMGSGP